jgi:FkbM family methyltransferase
VDLIRPPTEFTRLAAQAVDRFTLIDVGCSGGIAASWRVFGPRLRAVGFDSDEADILRLRRAETLSGVTYVAATVQDGVPASEFYRRGAWWTRNPWDRLAIRRSNEIRRARGIAARPPQDAGCAPPVALPAYCQAHGIDDVDFIKIDVDGADFAILRALRETIDRCAVLGVAFEVNFFGSDDPDANTFHNVDRLMRQLGFDLFGLTVRSYASDALPSPYMSEAPGPSWIGRPLQGDAVYLRDVPDHPAPITPDKLLKLACIFSLVGLPDMAAETIVRHRAVLEPMLATSTALDALAREVGRFGSYERHMRAFFADDRAFYCGRVRRLFRRLIKAIRP